MALFSLTGQPPRDMNVTNLAIQNKLLAQTVNVSTFDISSLNVQEIIADALDTENLVTENLTLTDNPTIGFVATCLDETGLVGWEQGGQGTGDVVGPGSSTDGALAVWNDTTGTLLRNSAITTANSNTALNFVSGPILSAGGVDLITTNASSVFFGRGTGTTTCTNCVAVGDGALAASTGSNCVAIGYEALAATVAGDNNTVVGANSATNAVGMDSCTIVGSGSADACTGSDNVGIGIGVLPVTTGSQNISIGNNSTETTTSGSGNVAIGYRANRQNVTGSNNVMLGNTAHSLVQVTNNSVVLGPNARVTSGDEAVIMGPTALGADRTIAISSGANAQGVSSICIAFGTTTLANSVLFDPGPFGATGGMHLPMLNSVGGGVAMEYDTGTGQMGPISSSKRYKEDWKDLPYDETIVEGLQPVTFKYKRDGKEDIGLLAEDVLQVAPRLVTFNKEGEPESIRYHMIGVYLLSEVQQLQDRVKALQAMA